MADDLLHSTGVIYPDIVEFREIIAVKNYHRQL